MEKFPLVRVIQKKNTCLPFVKPDVFCFTIQSNIQLAYILVERLKAQELCVSQFRNNKNRNSFCWLFIRRSLFCIEKDTFFSESQALPSVWIFEILWTSRGRSPHKLLILFHRLLPELCKTLQVSLPVERTPSQGSLLLKCLYKGSKHSWGICWPIPRGGGEQYLSNTRWNSSKGSVQVCWVITQLCEKYISIYLRDQKGLKCLSRKLRMLIQKAKKIF